MAVQLDALGEMLERASNVVAASSDYTCVFLWNPHPQTGGSGRAPWNTQSASGNDWIAIYSATPDFNDIYLSIGVGGIETDTTTPTAVQEDGQVALAYTRSGTTHTLYCNGGSIGTATEDVSAVTLTKVQLGGDGNGATTVDGAVQHFREWNSALTLAQIIAEWNSPTPIVTSGLQTNTPLTTNYEDTTANNNDWTPTGSPTFVLGPTPVPFTNIDGPTAQDLGDLSGAGWVQVTRQSGGTTGNAVYTYTPPVDTELVMSFWHFGEIGVYAPTLTIYSDEALTTAWASYVTYPAKPTIVPVTAGTQLWFKVFSGGGNPRACLWVRTEAWVQQAIPDGSLLINDAGIELPAIVLEGVAGEPVAYEPLPGGELMVQLADGTLLIQNLGNLTYDWFASDFSPIASIPNPGGTVSLGTDRATTFYIGSSATDTFRAYNASGGAGASYGPTAVNLVKLWPTRDNSGAYYAAGTVGAPVKQWTLATNSAAADLAAGVANYFVTEIMTLADDSVLVLYRRTGVDFQVIRYSAAGATLNIYSAQFAGLGSTDPHLALQASRDPEVFWVWGKIPNTGLSRFLIIETATGTVEQSFDQPNYTDGSYSPAATATPLALFQHSESCTFVIMDSPTPPECPGTRGAPPIGV